jgi:hypothetical protein
LSRKSKWFGISSLIGLTLIYALVSQNSKNDSVPYSFVDRDESGQPIPTDSKPSNVDELAPTVESDDYRPRPKNMSEEEFANSIRFEFANTDALPDGMSFTVSLKSLRVLSEEDPAIVTSYLMFGTGLSESDAEELGIELLALEKKFEIEKRRRRNELLCDNGVPRVYGDEVFTVFEQMDEISNAYSEEVFREFYESQSAEVKDGIRKWNDTAKLRTTVIRFKFKEHYAQTGGSADAVAARICLNNVQIGKGK